VTGLPSLAFVCEGNSEIPGGAFSGTAYSIVSHLRAAGHQLRTVDCEPTGWRRAVLAARTYRRSRARWQANFHFGDLAYATRSRLATRGIEAGPRPDAVIMVGGTFLPVVAPRMPLATYCDWNIALALRFAEAGHSPTRHMSARAIDTAMRGEAAIYRRSDLIYTTTDKLRDSFIEDFKVPAERVIACYAGPNMDPSQVPWPRAPRVPGQPPTILFVGKEFERKGGLVVLEAFRQVRAALPDARLRIMGPTQLPGGAADEPGVELMGLLRKSDPVDFRRIVDAYTTADLFCLPSLYDPSPIALVEAMLYGLPCVASDTWAMPERIVDGETGFVTPVGQPAPLAARLIELLRDPARARAMGAAGRARADALFTWPAVAARISESIRDVVESSRTRRPAAAAV
jgi:glycosyltransferase involved in cell wall biosynthesis